MPKWCRAASAGSCRDFCMLGPHMAEGGDRPAHAWPAPVMLTIHWVPNPSTHMPKLSPHGA